MVMKAQLDEAQKEIRTMAAFSQEFDRLTLRAKIIRLERYLYYGTIDYSKPKANIKRHWILLILLGLYAQGCWGL